MTDYLTTGDDDDDDKPTVDVDDDTVAALVEWIDIACDDDDDDVVIDSPCWWRWGWWEWLCNNVDDIEGKVESVVNVAVAPLDARNVDASIQQHSEYYCLREKTKFNKVYWKMSLMQMMIANSKNEAKNCVLLDSLLIEN